MKPWVEDIEELRWMNRRMIARSNGRSLTLPFVLLRSAGRYSKKKSSNWRLKWMELKAETLFTSVFSNFIWDESVYGSSVCGINTFFQAFSQTIIHLFDFKVITSCWSVKFIIVVPPFSNNVTSFDSWKREWIYFFLCSINQASVEYRPK
jgi:hypothetical protein